MAEYLRQAIAGIEVYVLAFLVSVLGGTVSYLSKVRTNGQKAFSVVELIGEWVTSGFAGLMTAYVCVAAGLSFELTAAFAGIAGHAGGRAISILEQKLLAGAGIKVPPTARDADPD